VIPEQFLEMAQAYRLLTELEPRQLRKLLPLAEEQHFDAGRLIFREGDQSSFLYLIVSGDIALEMIIEGAPVRVQMLHAGEAMGWSALSAECTTHFQARALTPVSTIAFPGKRVREACDRDSEVGYALMKRLLELVTERLDATRMQLVNMHREPESARQR
jgi:CRP/FNR family transcriptional regulator, cyclic AMP receptor protein